MPPFPDWVQPMAATLTQERFAGPEWIFEQKFDGIRLIAFKNGRRVQLLSRNRLPQNDAYPSVLAALESLAVHDVILDGEATGVWGRQGRPAYHVFDILRLDGRDLTALPLSERRQVLATMKLRAPVQMVPWLDIATPWVHACAKGWEGVIAKRLAAPYEHRRSPHWLKMKCEASQELVVGGFTDPQGTRAGLGALLVGYYAPRPSSGRPEPMSKGGDDFVFAGKVGTGLDVQMLLDLRQKLDAIEIASSPVTTATGLPRVRVHWVRPKIVVQVAFIEWTVHGKLRHSRLLGIRTDKSPRQVVREQ